MNEDVVRQKCEQFARSLGVPCFIVFGWKKDEATTGEQYGFVYSRHKMPPKVALQGMLWAVGDIVKKT
jgi:hypothetical protein